MTLRVCPLHHYYSPDHLAHVIKQMRVLGPPVLRGHFDGSTWFAREGTHRLRAAKALGLMPIMVNTPWPKSREALRRAQYAADARAHVFTDPPGSTVAT